MKIAICADPHLRGEDLPAVSRQLMELSKAAADCELLCVCGDIFHSPSIEDQHATVGAISEVAIDFISSFPAALLLVGNHDYKGAGSADALHVFDGMSNVSVSRVPERIIFRRGFDIGTWPWMWAPPVGCFRPAEEECDLFLGHVRIGGALMGRTQDYELKPGDWAMSRSDLEKVPAKHIALGDFHRRQDLTGRGGYVGALRQLGFGEEGNTQGFEILDTDTWEAQWVELSACPVHRTVEIMPGDPIPEQAAGERLRVRYLSAPSTDEVRHLEAQGVVVQHVVEREERVRRVEIPQGAMQDRRELIRLWAGAQNPPIGGERLENMLTVYGEVI